MALKLPIPVEELVNLDLPTDQDPDQKTQVGFRQATYQEMEMLADLDANTITEYNEEGYVARTINRSNWFTIRRKQVQLTMTACNIDNTDGSAPLFTFQRSDGLMRVNMSDKEFSAAWGGLPSKWANAIIEKMLAVNPQWKISRGE